MRFGGENMRRITLQKPVYTKSDSGQRVLTWADADSDPNPFAMVLDKRGDESYEGERKTATLVRFFQIHTRTDINEKWTIVEDGKRYDIKRIDRIGNRKLDIEGVWTQGQYE